MNDVRKYDVRLYDVFIFRYMAFRTSNIRTSHIRYPKYLPKRYMATTVSIKLTITMIYNCCHDLAKGGSASFSLSSIVSLFWSEDSFFIILRWHLCLTNIPPQYLHYVYAILLSILIISRYCPSKWSKSASEVSSLAEAILAVAAIHKSFLPIFRAVNLSGLVVNLP